MPALGSDLLMIERAGLPFRATAAEIAALAGTGPSWVKLPLDSANNTTTLANVAGMNFTAAALTTYKVKMLLPFTSAATTTGIAIALDVPTGATVDLVGWHVGSGTAVAITEQVADAAVTVISASVRAANTRTLLVAEALVTTGALGGTVQLMMRSEVAANAVTLKAGGIMGSLVI